MRAIITIVCLLTMGGYSHAEDRGLRFTAAETFLPEPKGIAIVKAGEPGPNAPKHKAIVLVGKYKETAKLADDGPFDVWWIPKNGMALRIAAGLKLNDGEVKEIKVDDHLGLVNVRGDNQPRVGRITIAPQDDPGPGEKGHVPIQTAKDFRVDMVVPEGFYSLWITPDNNARPRKIIDRFRALAGKTVQLD